MFTSLTITWKVLVTLKAGTPLSVTLTLTMFVLGPCPSVGVQLIAPVAGLMVMPAGELTRAKVRSEARRVGSEGIAPTFSAVCSLIVWSAGTLSTGARFTSLTITWNVLVTLKAGTPLSVTLTLTMFVLGPCPSVGVQLIAPVAGLMVMPAGELTKAKVKLLAGRSASEIGRASCRERWSGMV